MACCKGDEIKKAGGREKKAWPYGIHRPDCAAASGRIRGVGPGFNRISTGGQEITPFNSGGRKLVVMTRRRPIQPNGLCWLPCAAVKLVLG